MKIIGLMLVRNEDWVLEASIESALRWCDDLVFSFHKCADRTEEIVDTFWRKTTGQSQDGGNRIHICENIFSDVWDEMQARQNMLRRARVHGATHIAIIDADEILTANLLPIIRGEFEKLAPGEALDVPMLAMRGLGHYQDDDSVWSRAWLTLGFLDAPGLAWKPAGDGYQHHHRAPYGVTETRRYLADKLQGGAMHLQFANRRRLIAKHWLYAYVDHLRWPGRETPEQLSRKYSQALQPPGKLSEANPEWLAGHLKSKIRLDGIPWQEEELRKLIAQHGEAAFSGIDLVEKRPV